jgi:hypothetical protein
MAFKYVNRYMDYPEFEKDPAWAELDVMYPQAGHDKGALWHINNILMDFPRAIASFAAHWNTLDAAGKKQYEAAIGTYIHWIDPVWINDVLYYLDIAHLSWFVQYLAPEYGERLQQIYISKDLNQYLIDSVDANIGLATENQKAEHAAAVKSFLTKYAPDNWQESVPEATAVKVLSQIYKKEVAKAQTAAMEITQQKNMKIIGILVIGAFGVFLISRIGGRRKRA